MNARILTSRIAVLAIALTLSFATFQVAFAADGTLGAARAQSLGGAFAASAESALDSQAVTWRTITTPEQLRVLNLKNEGFGPGYYKIGADFTLGEQSTGDEIGTCALLSGKFVIDFNGHTVQSSCENLCTFTVQGANVTFMDSKASSDKVSVHALGLGCIEVRTGSATIVSGNYLCDKFTDAGGTAIAAAGGTMTVNGGAFKGSFAAATAGGGAMTINGGEFYGGYPYALVNMGSTAKIVRGKFYGAQTYYGYSFAIGALTMGQTFDLSSMLAAGSTWDNPGQCYCTSTTSSINAYPTMSHIYAATTGSAIVVSGKQAIAASNQSKTFGDKAFNLGASTNGDGALSYKSSNTKVATVGKDGKVTIKGAGKTKITVRASETDTSKAAKKTVKLTVKAAKNTLTAKGLSAAVSAKKVAKKTQATAKLVKVSKAKGAVTFQKKSGAKQLSIDKKSGKVKVKAGTKAGTYRMKVIVSTAGTSNFKKASRTVTVSVRVS